MNAKQLYLEDGKPAGVYWCEKCKRVHSTETMASECCKQWVCTICGEHCGEFRTICDACMDKRDAEKERALFDKAEKLTSWSGQIFHGEEFYSDVSTLLDDLLPTEYPEYVWATKPVQFVRLDADSITESVMDNAYEDFDIQDLRGMIELQKAITAFNEANAHHVAYYPDYTRAVLIDRIEGD